MPVLPHQLETREPAMEFHLLGRVGFGDCLALQRRLVYEVGGRDDGQIDVLICEHPEIVTVGRTGSRGHIRLSGEELRRRQLELRWVNRGGGCVLHAPGQLAVYPIVPLRWHGWRVGSYMQRFQKGLVETLRQLNVRHTTRPGSFGVWGRTGQLVAVGVAVRDWITWHGAFFNVNPSMSAFGYVDSAPPEAALQGQKTTMGCLLGEQRRAITMPKVRSVLIEKLAAAFDCQRYHLHTGHPLLVKRSKQSHESAARAS